jgi:hypothetical protein
MQRRDLIIASLLAVFAPLAGAEGETLNPSETIITLPAHIPWEDRKTYPRNSVTSAKLFGDRNGSGLYMELIKWFPGYMSAPHTYVTDRLCVVVSGTWWVNSGADFDPRHCVPVPAGSFVHRVADTPHYDGVVADGREPAVIAICGVAPVEMKFIDADKPGWRRV